MLRHTACDFSFSSNLEIPVYQPVGLKVVIVLPKRVDELLCNLQDTIETIAS